ncbi:MAG: hypothetical protein J2O48_01610 [Solirubrobacterales bacterium]|nr:hypothetical protein [Solirubrobacterales bacterium]
MERLNVTLEPEYGEKLRRLAEQRYLQPGTLARALLSEAIDLAELDGARMTAILDAIPGAWDRMDHAMDQVRRGETVPLEELDQHV